MFTSSRVHARGSLHALLVIVLSAAIASCGRTVRVTLPSGTGTPFPEFLAAYSEATAPCRDIKTMSASLALSGRAGSTKLAARIDAGFAEPSRLRLEGYPRINFGGKPFFVLVADGESATLVLTRDDRVLRGAAPSAIVEALAGVALDPGELRAVVSGCALGAVQPAAGRAFADGWVAVDAGVTTVFLRQQDGVWRVAAARRRTLTIEYSNFTNGRPSTIHLLTTSEGGSAPANLTVRASQVEIDTPLNESVFDVEVPRSATPITLEELTRALRSQ
jgi:outer membrane lipoprotein-sorting protein